MDWASRAGAIKALVLDVDGVLTDGTVGYTAEGTVKFFFVQDGHAIKLAMRAGLKVGILSGRSDPANRRRADDLQLSFIYEGEKDKRAAFARLLAEQQLTAAECCYMGDDVVDLPVLRQVGLAVAAANAAAEVLPHVHYVTEHPGGRGAVREVIVKLLQAQGRWEELMSRYVG